MMMDCESSPIIRNKKRLADAVMSPIRKSIAAISSTPVVPLNDDVAERNRRRSHAELQRRVSNIVPHSSGQANNETNGLTGQQLQNHFENCLQMFNENKITTKNVWSLHIIDYMRTILNNSGSDALQMASVSLDVSAKIYGLRVDDLHNEALKLAQQMASANANKNNTNADDPEAFESGEENECANNDKAKKKKKKRRSFDTDDTRRLTINRNLEQLDDELNVFDGFSSLFCGLPESGSLFSCSFPKVKCRFEIFIRNKSDTYLLKNEVSLEKDTVSPLRGVQFPNVTGNISTAFSNFIIDKWDPEHEENELGPSFQIPNDVVYDDQGIPIPELDVEMDAPDSPDMDDMADDDVLSEMTAVAQHGNRLGIEKITDLRPGYDGPIRQLEYSYRPNPNVSQKYMIIGMWAGPSHWKLKCLHRNKESLATTSNAGIAKQKRSKKIASSIEWKSKEDLKKLIVWSKTNSFKRTTIPTNIERLTLPEDIGITNKDKTALKLKNRVHIELVKRSLNNPTNMSNMNMSNYEYVNANDAEYCSQSQLEDDCDGDNHVNDDVLNDITENNLTDDLVSAPPLVQKVDIPYAMQSKKMDMKKLKTAVWRELIHDDSNTSIIADVADEVEEIEVTSLSKVYEALPERLPERMAKDLSLALAFVALLQLANEHGLELQGINNLTDVQIIKK